MQHYTSADAARASFLLRRWRSLSQIFSDGFGMVFQVALFVTTLFLGNSNIVMSDFDPWQTVTIPESGQSTFKVTGLRDFSREDQSNDELGTT